VAKISVLFGSDLQAEYNLDKDELTIGRAADCDIVVDNMGVSRHHASIVKDGAGWAVVDKGSNNGSFVNGQRITTHKLKDRDRVVLGKFHLVFDAYGYATGAHKKAAGGLGSEMTMFVDPAQMEKMQADLAKGGGPKVLALLQSGREVRCQLTKAETLLGKGPVADVPIKGFLVKPIQAKLVKTDSGHRIISLGGWRAVRVNGAKVKEASLKPGDVITLAGISMTYRDL
jgi:pSer/pThr/pTyr-binding forkhead associated (FHA) protein